MPWLQFTGHHSSLPSSHSWSHFILAFWAAERTTPFKGSSFPLLWTVHCPSLHLHEFQKIRSISNSHWSTPSVPPGGGVSRHVSQAHVTTDHSPSWWSRLPRLSTGGTIDWLSFLDCKTIKIILKGKLLTAWHSTIFHNDWNIIVPRDLWGPGDTLSVLGSRRGSQGLLLALCDFPSRGAVSTRSGEGSRLEGRPGTPLLLYLGSSQSEAYSSDCRPLSRCGGLSPGAAAANGCLSSCNMNTAASADCLQPPP